jgi:hypothetical protein
LPTDEGMPALRVGESLNFFGHPKLYVESAGCGGALLTSSREVTRTEPHFRKPVLLSPRLLPLA